MPFRRRAYKFMLDDGLDTRIPVYSDEVFKQGIHFCAKFVGNMDIPRPQNRLEIVSSMRRVRFEFKEKGIKKQKVLIKVSTDGVFVYTRQKPKFTVRWPGFKPTNTSATCPSVRVQSDTQFQDASSLADSSIVTADCEANSVSSGGVLGMGVRDSSTLSCIHQSNLILCHPIYRIFYVSHDSQDLNIFSYIARDSRTSVFRCNVFKAYKKLQAMRIVRTIGQAFDVCHRIAIEKQQQNGMDHSLEKEIPTQSLQESEDSSDDDEKEEGTRKRLRKHLKSNTDNQQGATEERSQKRKRSKADSKKLKTNATDISTQRRHVKKHNDLNKIEHSKSRLDCPEVDFDDTPTDSVTATLYRYTETCTEDDKMHTDETTSQETKVYSKAPSHSSTQQSPMTKKKRNFSLSTDRHSERTGSPHRSADVSNTSASSARSSRRSRSSVKSDKASSMPQSRSSSGRSQSGSASPHTDGNKKCDSSSLSFDVSQALRQNTYIPSLFQKRNIKNSFTVQDLVWMLGTSELSTNEKCDFEEGLKLLAHRRGGQVTGKPDLCQSRSVDTNLARTFSSDDDKLSSYDNSRFDINSDRSETGPAQINYPWDTGVANLKLKGTTDVPSRIQLEGKTETGGTDLLNNNGEMLRGISENSGSTVWSQQFDRLLLKLYNESGVSIEGQEYLKQLLRQNRDMRQWLNQMSERLRRLELMTSAQQYGRVSTSSINAEGEVRQTSSSNWWETHNGQNGSVRDLVPHKNNLTNQSGTSFGVSPGETTRPAFNSKNPFRIPRSLSTFSEAIFESGTTGTGLLPNPVSFPTSSTMADLTLKAGQSKDLQTDPFIDLARRNEIIPQSLSIHPPTTIWQTGKPINSQKTNSNCETMKFENNPLELPYASTLATRIKDGMQQVNSVASVPSDSFGDQKINLVNGTIPTPHNPWTNNCVSEWNHSSIPKEGSKLSTPLSHEIPDRATSVHTSR